MGLFTKKPVSISLKTHRCYPEIMVEEDGSWEGKLIAGDGAILRRFQGKVPCGGLSYMEVRKSASTQAVSALSKAAEEHLIKE